MQKALLVLAYPTLSREDYTWIQAIRATHDEVNYQLVKPHFTLVFPSYGVKQDRFITHIKAMVADFPVFHFVLRSAIVAKDSFNESTHVFLVPDEGHSYFIKLHDRLYTGRLSPELRLDIPYIPHIGVANAINPEHCKKVVDDLNAQNFAVTGQIVNLDIVVYANDRVETISQVKLA